MPIASFQVNLVLKMKYTPNAKKFGTQNNLSTLIINMIFKIADLDPKLNTWADLVSKLLVANFIKFGTQNKLNMLIMNILVGSDDLDPKLQICENWSQKGNVFQFL